MLRTYVPVLSFLLLPVVGLAQEEICNNGIDDDGNGLIDLNDPACPCSTFFTGEGQPSFIRNHSFEEQACCPLGVVGPDTEPWLSCASGWMQATSATSDYFHACGYSPAGMPLPPPDGEGAVGFFAYPEYFEYVGTCLTDPGTADPLRAGTAYTLSLWIASTVSVGMHEQTVEQADPSRFAEQLPLTIFGHANTCVGFPISTNGCMGDEPGWTELGQVMVQPAWEWTRVSITFIPTQDIHSVIIGGGCDIPSSYIGRVFSGGPTGSYFGKPYFLVDDLMLTEAGDPVFSPVAVSGALCAGNALAVGQPPAGATGYQWYHDGVALPGRTGTTLDVSADGLGAGLYTMASTYNGQCLMGAASVPPEVLPLPVVTPSSGCAPLTVAFASNIGDGSTTVSWDLGDGTTRTDHAFTHTYAVPGNYDVRLTVRNGAGCERDTLVEHAVTVLPGVTGLITATPNPVDIEDPVVFFSSRGSTGDIVSWWWDLGAGSPSTSTDPSPIATFPAEPGSYPVMLVVTGANGCVDTVRSVITITRLGVIEMPNVFSPNGDGHNDRFVPLDHTGASGLLEIYSRWGQLVFSTTALALGWDGRAEGSDVPEGTYYYIVKPDDVNVEELAGHVTLIR